MNKKISSWCDFNAKTYCALLPLNFLGPRANLLLIFKSNRCDRRGNLSTVYFMGWLANVDSLLTLVSQKLRSVGPIHTLCINK
jgi:hypothetical protein